MFDDQTQGLLQEEIKLTRALADPLSQLQQTARRIAEISQESKLDIEPDAYVESFKPFSMDITYHWSKVQQRLSFSNLSQFSVSVHSHASDSHCSCLCGYHL